MKYMNESNLDRLLRTLAGIILLIVGFGGMLTGTLGLVAKIIGVLLVVTGLAGFCPIYALLKIKTKA